MPLFLLAITLLFCPGLAHGETLPLPPSASPLTSSLYDPVEKFLWAATPQNLFLTSAFAEPSGGWQTLNSFPPGEQIRRLLPDAGRGVFILTDRAVFKQSASEPLEKIFNRVSGENQVLTFASSETEELWLAGTAAGLFLSRDHGLSWTTAARFSGKRVSFISASGPYLVADEFFLYRGETLDAMEPVWRFRSNSPGTAESESEEAETGRENFIPEAVQQDNRLWLTTREGILVSHDRGRTWSLLSSAGLENQPLQRLALAPRSGLLIAASSRGLFAARGDGGRWFRLPQSLYGQIVSLAVLDGSPETVLAATTRELISLPLVPEHIFQTGDFPAPHAAAAFREKIDAEPSPLAVQKAVLRASGLDGSKIKRWHTESRLRALVPSVSFGKDYSRGNSIDLDRGGTSDPDVYIYGPDDIDEGWSFDVRWDLADLIWSSAQTSIDVRQKLLIDQRRDFLSEAMRIYFERRRLQAELFFGDYEAPAEGFTFQYEKRLRLDELTSMLDALTGGWFSAQLAAG